MYTGISGITHGERKDIRPSRNTRIKLILSADTRLSNINPLLINFILIGLIRPELINTYSE